MRLSYLYLYLTVGFIYAQCPDEDRGLALWSDPDIWGGQLPSSNDVVIIDSAVKLDVPSVQVRKIRVVSSGKLVFGDDQDISIKTYSILVQDKASLIIGSHSCRFQHDVNIKLIGLQTSGRVGVGNTGEKYIVVEDEGNLQIHGKEVLAFTKLSATADRWETFSGDANKVIYMHKASEYADYKPGYQGPAMYIFDQSFTPKLYKVYDFIKSVGQEDKEQDQVDNMASHLDSIEDGDIVAIATQKCWEITTASLTDLDDKLQSLVGATNSELRFENLGLCDAYALVFQKGGDHNLVVDQHIGKVVQHAIASIVVNQRKVTAVSHVDLNSIGKSIIDFRILSLDLGYPTITVVDDLTTSAWKTGDEIMLTSTDFIMYHAEVRTIKEITGPHTIVLSDELDYRHFGKIEDNIDMRGEVAHLTRNIKLEGEIQRGCPPSNGNCGDCEECVTYDTFGAHLKILFGFGSVAIQGVQLTRFGQLMNKGHYPLHFHVCGFVGEKEALLRNNVIRNSFQRAIVVHGTYGTSEASPGVIVTDNIAYDILGTCFFVEDGAEKATIFERNLGAVIKAVANGFTEDLRKPAVFWWTTPEVAFIDNVAAGSDGFGFWLTIPLDVVGPSAKLGVYEYEEAKHTPLYTIDNNVAHSNFEGGFNLQNILLDENGTTFMGLNYEPRSDPLDPDSEPVKAQIVRLTAYKNFERNCWIEAGPVEVIHYSSAESRMGIQLVRSGYYGQFLKKSIIVGQSKENHEDEDYPDAMITKRYTGFVIWSGPVFAHQTWFDGFKSEPGLYVSGAIGFFPKTPYPSSSVSNTTDLRFGFKDKKDGKYGNRVFVGTIEDAEYGYSENMDGDESKTFLDGDGSVTRCPEYGYSENMDGDESKTFLDGDGGVTRCPAKKSWKRPMQVVKPEKFAAVDSCRPRPNWKMFVCDDLFGKVRVYGTDDFNGVALANDSTQAMRLNREDPNDVAYEDHTGKKATDYITVLGSDKYYYAVQMLLEFPKTLSLHGRAVEKDYGVVVGVCLPKKIGYDDIEIKANIAGLGGVKNHEFQHVNSIDEVFADKTMSKVFLDQRILYIHMVSDRTRDYAWHTLEAGECPQDSCPYFEIKLLVDSADGYTHCFKPTPEELGTDNALSDPIYKTMGCELPSSQPEKDWGSGDYYKVAIDGQWGDYGPWTPCCPATTQTRKRLCDNPPPYGQGKDCMGDAEETRACIEPCSLEELAASVLTKQQLDALLS